jgi:tetratricopeptide (TPR) repeat protein
MSKKRSTLAIASGISALLLLTVASCSTQSQSPNAASTISAIVGDPAKKPVSWKFANEQEWIIDSIGRDIAEMLVFAKFHDQVNAKVLSNPIDFQTTIIDKNANKYKFRLLVPNTKTPIEYEFAIKEYTWNPENYAPFVSQLMQALQLKAAPSSDVPPEFLKALAGAEMSGLFAENERISKALSTTPLDANLHQQAALLQATFDMLELAGNFSDTRPPLNRMSAHLAIAKATNGGAQLNTPGQIADIALESMSCRDAVAIQKGDALAKTDANPDVQSWLRALKIRSSGNYRLFDEQNQTPLEASQFGMRFSNFLGSDKMLEYMSKHNCTPEVRWMRIAECGGMSVEGGHEITSRILPAELKEFYKSYNLYTKQTLNSNSAMTSELNRMPTRCLSTQSGSPQLVALSWDDVAAYHARHIVAAADSLYDFNAHSYGVPEEAKQVLEGNAKLLSGMMLYPLTLISVRDNENQKEAHAKFLSGAEQIIIDHPELMTGWAWGNAKVSAAAEKPPAVLTHPELWFDPPYPTGTAYYYDHRKRYLENCKPDLAELTQLRKICPLQSAICTDWTKKKYGEHPTSDQLREGFGDLVNYDLHVMRETADGDYNSPAKYEQQMEKLAKLSPNDYFGLAYYCVRQGEPEKAKGYFLTAIEKAENPVMSSNGCEWIVGYLYDHGDKAKAMEIANNAAEVYSQGGLTTLAKLYERMGDLQKAEEYFLKSKERYADSRDEIGFYTRNATKDKRYAAESERLLKKDFPTGLKRIELAQLKSPPKAGVVITESNFFAEKCGLKLDCVVEGLNGYFADNSAQYDIVRDLTIAPAMKAIFWDGQKHNEVAVETVCTNKMGIQMEDYNGSSPAPAAANPK